MLDWATYEKWLDPVLCQSIDRSQPVPHPSDFTTDSRKIDAGQWFIPIVGEKFDGHKFITAAVKQSQAGFFYESNAGLSSEILKYGIKVSNTLEALQALAHGWRSFLPKLKVIALTGSVGKTTTREMIKHIASTVTNVHSTKGNYNNEIGVPLSILQIKESDRISILEFGARHTGDISFLTKMAQPDVVGCLNVGSAHLGEFGSVENLIRTKLEIYRSSPESCICVSPTEDKRILSGAKATYKRIVGFGSVEGSQIFLSATKWLPNGRMLIELIIDDSPISVEIGGAHSSYPINVCAAAAFATAAGISPISISYGLKEFSGVPGRYKLHQGSFGFLVDDSYNASPESMLSGFESVKQSFGSKKKTIILGDMLELGAESEDVHRKTGIQCQELLDPDTLLLVGEAAKFIGEGAIKSGLSPNRVSMFTNVDELLALNLNQLLSGEIIYIKGSNGIQLSRIVDTIIKKG